MKEPIITFLDPKKLIGIHTTMSLVENKTAQLWRTFMPRRHEVAHRVSTDYFSMQVYKMFDESAFLPSTVFEKWAAVEVGSLVDIPVGMERYDLEGGMYAMFEHKGPASAAPQIMRYIFAEWLPNSKFVIDQREHFEILPEGYNPMDPEAQEEIYIPIKNRT